MFELLKFANENNVNIDIKVMDGSYRPLVGEVINIITFSNINDPSRTSQVTVLKTDSDNYIKNKIISAISAVVKTKDGKSYSEMMEAREKFFHGI